MNSKPQQPNTNTIIKTGKATFARDFYIGTGRVEVKVHRGIIVVTPNGESTPVTVSLFFPSTDKVPTHVSYDHIPASADYAHWEVYDDLLESTMVKHTLAWLRGFFDESGEIEVVQVYMEELERRKVRRADLKKVFRDEARVCAKLRELGVEQPDQAVLIAVETYHVPLVPKVPKEECETAC